MSDRVPNGRLILVGGGARSGKSRFALARAAALGPRRLFVATAEARDEEMAHRIARHRRERGDGFVTLEEPLRLTEALTTPTTTADVVLVDCLTLWVANLLDRGAGGGDLAAAFTDLEGALARRRCHVVLVSNEVGMGLVPDNPLGRAFRDAIGDLHGRLAARADELYLAALGTVLRLRPAPVEAVDAESTATWTAAPAS